MATRKNIPVVKCEQNGKQFFLASISSHILKNVCTISRRSENPKKGFQRLLNKNRARDIARYLDEETGVIPSALIVSAQPSSKIEYDPRKQTISFSETEDGFLVLDGQHRLFGLKEAKKDYDFPIVIFIGLNTSEEVKLFIDINTTQKGVPSALLLDIKQLAGIETKIEELQREVFDKLNNKSVLSGYLSPSSSVAGKISRSAFNEATKEIFHSGLLSGKPVDWIYSGMKNYLEAAERAFRQSHSESAQVYKTVLFKSLFMLFNDVITRSLNEKKNMKVDSLTEILNPLSKLDFDSYIGTNKATIKKITEDMRAEINQYNQVKADMF
jgi:DNA sulfur modification protein DndB